MLIRDIRSQILGAATYLLVSSTGNQSLIRFSAGTNSSRSTTTSPAHIKDWTVLRLSPLPQRKPGPERVAWFRFRLSADCITATFDWQPDSLPWGTIKGKQQRNGVGLLNEGSPARHLELQNSSFAHARCPPVVLTGCPRISLP
jgi:hypothetical protein